jgi:hypothetical protein
MPRGAPRPIRPDEGAPGAFRPTRAARVAAGQRRRAQPVGSYGTYRSRLIPHPQRPTGSTVSPEGVLIAVSLIALGVLLAVLSFRGLRKFFQDGARSQLWWGSGLALATVAMVIEAVVYLGVVTMPLLQAYMFVSAGIVGVLSLGATRILKNARVEAAYTYYTLAGCVVVALFCAITPVSTGIVVGGIISGNPPVLILVLSSFVTVPATVVLLAASALSLRRSWRWQTLLMAAGALVLGAGGTLYIASFPVALYYAEFIGILMLFLGLISLPQPTTATAPTVRAAGAA